MAKRLKRAFTITELVIVIAVVAILAAVLIPTFSNIIKKANESADTQTIVNMNHILNAEQILDGKPDTMEEAVLVIEQGGYKVENLTPTTDGYDIVWDEENNRLALLDKDGKTVYCETELTAQKEKIWKITEQVPANDGYSYYLAPGFTGTSVTAYAGLDVGKNTQIASVAVEIPTAAVDVKVRTKGGDLTVNAPNATVRHYDDVNGVDVQAVADASYHEYGNVAGEFTVANGHVTLESGSKTNEIYVTGNAVKIDWKSDAKPVSVGISAGVDQSTVTVQTDSDVPVVSDVDEAEKSLFAGGFGTEASPYLIATAEQFKNIATLQNEMQAGKSYFFLQTKDIEFTYTLNYFRGTYDGGGNKITVSDSLPAVAQNVTSIFNYAYGNTELKNVDLYSRETYALVALWTGDYVSNFTMTNVNFRSVDNKTPKVYCDNFGFFVINAPYDGRSIADGVQQFTFENCNTFTGVQNKGTCTAAFIGGGIIRRSLERPTALTFRNCHNYGDISGMAQAGVIVGNSSYNLSFDVSAGDNNDDYREANVTADEVEMIVIDNVTNEGTVAADSVAAFSSSLGKGFILNELYQDTIGGSYESIKGKFDNEIFTVVQNGSSFSIDDQKGGEGRVYEIAFSLNNIVNQSGSVSNGRKLFVSIPYKAFVDGDVLFDPSNVHAYDENTAREKGIIAEGTVVEYNLYCAAYEAALLFGSDGTLNIIIKNDGAAAVTSVTDSVSTYIYGFTVNGTLIGYKAI